MYVFAAGRSHLGCRPPPVRVAPGGRGAWCRTAPGVASGGEWLACRADRAPPTPTAMTGAARAAYERIVTETRRCSARCCSLGLLLLVVCVAPDQLGSDAKCSLSGLAQRSPALLGSHKADGERGITPSSVQAEPLCKNCGSVPDLASAHRRATCRLLRQHGAGVEVAAGGCDWGAGSAGGPSAHRSNRLRFRVGNCGRWHAACRAAELGARRVIGEMSLTPASRARPPWKFCRLVWPGSRPHFEACGVDELGGFGSPSRAR